MTQFTITELRRSGDSVHELEIYGEKIVWSSWNGKKEKILLYDGNKTVEIKNTNGAFPEISGENLVWSAADSEGDREIFFCNGKETVQLTDNHVDDVAPQVSGDNIVWGRDSFYAFRTTYVNEIFLDNTQDLVRLNDNSSSNTFPVISGNNVAWSGVDSEGNRQVFYYNGKKTIQISKKEHLSQSHFRGTEEKVAWNFDSGKSNDVEMLGNDKNNIQLADVMSCVMDFTDPFCNRAIRDDYSPQISGNNVVWEIGGNLFFYNGRETVSIDDHNRAVHGDSVQISGDNVVWTADDSDGDEEIFFHNGKETIQLTDNNVSEYSPQVSGDNVVWIGGNDDPLKREIFLYDGNKTLQITKNSELADVSPQLDWNPRIDGNMVVWTRSNFIDNTTSIMMATIDDTQASSLPTHREQMIINSSMVITLVLISICLLPKLFLK